MKECTNCGWTYDDSVNVCGRCGIELNYVEMQYGMGQSQQNMQYGMGQPQQNMQYGMWQQPQQNMQYGTDQYQPNAQIKVDKAKEKKPNKSRKVIIFATIALAVIAIIVGVVLLMGGTPDEEFYMENVPEEILEYQMNGESYTSEITQVKIVKEEKDGDELTVLCELYVEDECLKRTLHYEFECEKDGKWEIEDWEKVEEESIELSEEFAKSLIGDYELDNIDNYKCTPKDEDGIIRFSYDVNDQYNYVTVGGTVAFEVSILEERGNKYFTSIEVDTTNIEADWTVEGSYINTDEDTGGIDMGVTLKPSTDGQMEVEVYSEWLGLDYGTAQLPTSIMFSQTGRVYCIVECQGQSPELKQKDRIYKVIFYGDEIYECRVNYDGGRGYFPLIPGEYDLEEIMAAKEEEVEPEIEPSHNVDSSETVDYDKINNEIIYVYSFNSEVGNRLDTHFRTRYPEFSDLVVYVNLEKPGLSEEYYNEVNKAFDGDEPPSIVAYDIDAAHNLTNGNFIPIYSSGITEEMYSNAYDYTKDVVTFDGNLMGITWQTAPGCFVYNPAIAEEVLGFSDPVDVNGAIEDWDKFLEAAEMLKQKGYYIIPCIEELTVGGGEPTPQYVIDAVIENGYAGNYSQWSTEWMEYPDDVFGYFGCSWFVYWSLNQEIESRICEGPRDYFWGGSYLGATKECANPELRELVLYTLCCDKEAMYDMYDIDVEVPNNKESIAMLIADGKDGVDHLGGQKELELFDEKAKNIDIE